MAAIVADFSRAMKAVDPTIQVGASGWDGDAWWASFLPAAAPHIDFISLSLYNTWGWKSYDRFLRQPKPDLVGSVRNALAAIDRYVSETDRSRLKVVVSETNSKDYSANGWLDTPCSSGRAAPSVKRLRRSGIGGKFASATPRSPRRKA